MCSIFDGCETAVVNADDPLVCEMPRPGQRVLTFSLEEAGADYCFTGGAQPSLACRGEPLLPVSAMRLKGRHNVANALAALAMSEALDLPRAAVIEALARFGGLAHRAQWIADVAGIHFVNDSKGTNVGATVAAVSGMSGTIVLIGGGDGKGQDFGALRQAFRGRVRHAVLIGRDAQRLSATLDGVCSTEIAPDMPSAVRAARAAAQPGDTVLLSPACGSLDMFRDYAHRGDEFAASVRGLAA
jgi:UDP-N-acetylmuramoylalanine--D-glutamate ligase